MIITSTNLLKIVRESRWDFSCVCLYVNESGFISKLLLHSLVFVLIFSLVSFHFSS